MRSYLLGTIAAVAVIAAAPALAQDQQRDACVALSRYVQERQGQDLGVGRDDLRRLEQSGDQQRCQAQIEWFEARVQNAGQNQGEQAQGDQGGQIVIQQTAPAVRVDQAEPQITVTQNPPTVNVTQPQPEIIVHQPAPQVTINIPQPQITVRMPDPNVQVSQNQPEVQVRQPEPQVQLVQPKQKPQVLLNQDQQQAQVDVQGSDQPNVQVQRAGRPNVRYEAEDPQVHIQRAEGQPKVTFEATDTRAADGQRQQTASAGSGNRQPSGEDLQATQDETGSTAVGQQPNADMKPFAASDLTGRTLVNARGNELGEVDSLVVDTRSQNRVLAVVSYGGFLGVGEKQVTIPLERLTLMGDRLVVEGLSDDQLRQLPDYRENSGMQRLDGGQQTEIRVKS